MRYRRLILIPGYGLGPRSWGPLLRDLDPPPSQEVVCYRYDAISLPALLRRLALEYDVKIELCTDAFDDKTFRISITEAQDIESIMGGLCDILPISVRRDTCGYRVDSRPRKTEP